MQNYITYAQAIRALVENADFEMTNEMDLSTITWNDSRNEPTKSEIDLKVSELQSKADDFLRVQKINEFITEKSNEATKGYSMTEILSFFLQVDEAKQLLTTGNEDSESIIYTLAQIDGITTLEFAQKVLLKASGHKQQLIQLLVYKRQQLQS